MPRDPLVAWDTSVLLALIKDETRAEGEMDGVYEWARRVDSGEVRLILSSMFRMEILESTLPMEALEKLDQILDRSNVVEVEMGPRVINKASELRDYYQRRREIVSAPGLSTPDAIHLATAILYGVDQFHTFDERDKPSSLGLIPLSGDVAGHPLVICKPPVDQFALDLDKGQDNSFFQE
jgi:predicted nucleic acid-binding protein